MYSYFHFYFANTHRHDRLNSWVFVALLFKNVVPLMLYIEVWFYLIRGFEAIVRRVNHSTNRQYSSTSIQWLIINGIKFIMASVHKGRIISNRVSSSWYTAGCTHCVYNMACLAGTRARYIYIHTQYTPCLQRYILQAFCPSGWSQTPQTSDDYNQLLDVLVWLIICWLYFTQSTDRGRALFMPCCGGTEARWASN